MSDGPRVLVTGSDGQLGRELVRVLPPQVEIHALNRGALDLADPDAIVARCREIRPALILNPGAYTAVDKAEAEPELAMKVNGVAPGVLGEEARRLGATVVHFSTDYVFDGKASQPYREDDPTNPQSVYGRTKLAGEKALAQSGAAHLIFRTSWLYATHGKNFFLTMLRLARERAELRVVADQVGAPTWVRPLAAAAVGALDFQPSGITTAVAPGLYHLSAGGQTSWHGFAAAILADVADPDRRATAVRAITTAEYPTPATRPAFSVLDNTRFVQTGRPPLADWQAMLHEAASVLAAGG